MKLCLRIGLLLLLVSGTLSQGGFDLSDALDDLVPATPKPKDVPKVPEKPKTDDGLDLFDALGPDPPATLKPKKPSSGDSDGGLLDLGDALGPDPNPKPKPDKPAVNPGGGGGGGTFDDKDLFDIGGGGGGGGGYKPDGGHSGGGGGRGVDPGYDPHGGPEEPQEAGSGKIAGIVSAVGMALLGAASSYFAYQKKKLCFKVQGGGADPERGKGQYGQQSDPQVFSNLLRTS